MKIVKLNVVYYYIFSLSMLIEVNKFSFKLQFALFSPIFFPFFTIEFSYFTDILWNIGVHTCINKDIFTRFEYR